MKETEWVSDDGHSVTLHRVESDDTVIVDGTATNVKKGTLLHPAGDNVGYWSVNEKAWRAAGLHPKSAKKPDTDSKPVKKAPARKVASSK
jgi:hypothetical protein